MHSSWSECCHNQASAFCSTALNKPSFVLLHNSATNKPHSANGVLEDSFINLTRKRNKTFYTSPCAIWPPFSPFFQASNCSLLKAKGEQVFFSFTMKMPKYTHQRKHVAFLRIMNNILHLIFSFLPFYDFCARPLASEFRKYKSEITH